MRFVNVFLKDVSQNTKNISKALATELLLSVTVSAKKPDLFWEKRRDFASILRYAVALTGGEAYEN